MQLLALLHIECQVFEKNGKIFAQVFDAESMNLVFEKECDTLDRACVVLAGWVDRTVFAALNHREG